MIIPLNRTKDSFAMSHCIAISLNGGSSSGNIESSLEAELK